MNYTTTAKTLMEALHKINGYFKKDESISNSSLQLLEPLTSIVRLAMLKFEKVGTKIAISNNRIAIQSPTFLQGTLRWAYGNKRNELHNLYKPILVATQYYDTKGNNDVDIIFNYAIEGLDNLAQTYSEHENDIVCHSIKLYKEILFKKNKTKAKQLNEDDVTLPLYEQFNSLWTEEQVQIIAMLLNEANKDNEETPAFLQAIDHILKSKENLAIKIINAFTLNIAKH